MRTRQALKPGRVKLTFEDGGVKYAVLERADDPVVEGHPLNPYTLLKDETCKMLGGDPETMVPDDAFQMLAALAASGGGSGDAGELEDTTLEVGFFNNAGAGWNTYNFREEFDAAPQVVLQAENFEGVALIKDITAKGFLYCLRTTKAEGGSVTTGSYFTASGIPYNSAHSAQTLVNGVTLPANGSTTAEAVKINYIATEYGGER